MFDLAATVGSAVEAGTQFLISGKTSINLLQVNGVGLLQVDFDAKKGVSATIGSGGVSMELGKVINGLSNGLQTISRNHQIDRFVKDTNIAANVAFRTQYGFGDANAIKQMNDLVAGRALLEFGGLPEDAEAQTIVNEKGQRICAPRGKPGDLLG